MSDEKDLIEFNVLYQMFRGQDAATGKSINMLVKLARGWRRLYFQMKERLKKYELHDGHDVCLTELGIVMMHYDRIRATVKELAALRAEVERLKLHLKTVPPLLSGVKTTKCEHSNYWITAFGKCMACEKEALRSRLDEAVKALELIQNITLSNKHKNPVHDIFLETKYALHALSNVRSASPTGPQPSAPPAQEKRTCETCLDKDTEDYRNPCNGCIQESDKPCWQPRPPSEASAAPATPAAEPAAESVNCVCGITSSRNCPVHGNGPDQNEEANEAQQTKEEV